MNSNAHLETCPSEAEHPAVPIQKPPSPFLLKKQRFSWLILHLGVLIVALGVHFFKFPNHFAMGGVSGIAVVLGKLLPWLTPAWASFALNMLLLLVGLVVFGKGFAAKTAYATALLSVLQVVLERLFPIAQPLTNDTLLELFFAIFFSSFGSALLFNEYASTGGTDIIAMIVRKYANLDIGKALLLSDLVIGTSTFFIFDIKTGLYSVAGILLKGVVVDSFLESLNRVKYCTIITVCPDEIGHYVTGKLKRGCTRSSGEGFYTHKDCAILLTVLNSYQAVLLRDFVKKTDPEAFMMITNTSEIVGRGFHSAF